MAAKLSVLGILAVVAVLGVWFFNSGYGEKVKGEHGHDHDGGEHENEGDDRIPASGIRSGEMKNVGSAAKDAQGQVKAGMTGLEENVKEAANDLEWPDDVPGLPKIPELTGDAEKDKAALVSALKQLQTAWETNKTAHQQLIANKEKKDSKQLQELKRNNDVYQKFANKLQDMIDEVRG